MRFAIAIIFIWTGFILSISFFESWVKFRAAGVTTPVALSIGKLVFTVLNRIEWAFMLLITISLFASKVSIAPVILYLMIAVIAILLLQTFWLLPQLNVRAVSRINGIKTAPSSLHHYFVLAEFIKLACLIVVGIKLFKFLN